MQFDLREEPWIPVLTPELVVREVSLRELFAGAASFKEVVGDNPPVTVALNRMLLAIIHRAHRGPVDAAHWNAIAAGGQGAVLAYLDEMGDRFDLGHAEHPFMQDLALGEAQAAPAYVASAWQPENTSTVFTHAHAWRTRPLTAAAAARTLLRIHAVDTPGMKGAHPQGGSNRSACSSALMNSQMVWVRGDNLWHTLMLNLMRYDGANAVPFSFAPDADLPAWERPASPPGDRLIAGPADSLTFMWRRVRLVWQDDRVVGIALTKGHAVPDSHAPISFEWAIPIVQETDPKTGVTTRRPLRASLERRVWRDAPALLQSASHLTTDNRRHQAPPLLEWLAQLRRTTKTVPRRLRVEVVAMVADQAKPLGWYAQALTLPLRYLEDEELWGRLHEAIALAEKHEECLRTFKGSPYQVLGEALKLDAKALAAFDGRIRFWAGLESPFLQLLNAMPEDEATDEIGDVVIGEATLSAWEALLRRAAENAFNDSIGGIRDYRARALGIQRLNKRLHELAKPAPQPVVGAPAE